MATDWAADVKKYAAKADDAIIKGIVRYCGIALTKGDSSLVAFSDPKELDRVRNNFLKKKLGRTEADSVLDAAIAKVGETMKADRTKNRVTVYYLLADHYKSLALFAPKDKAAAKAPAKAPVKKAEAKPAAKTATKVAGAAVLAAGAAATAKKPAAKAAPAKKAAAPAKAATPAAKVAAPAKKAAAPAAKAAAPAKKAAAPAKAAAPVKKAAAPAKKAASTAKVAAVAAAGGALGLASAVPAAAKTAASTATGAAKAAAGAVGDVAKGAVDTAADVAKAATGAVGDVAKAATGAVGDAAKATTDAGAAVVGAAAAGAAGAAAMATGAAGKAASAVTGGVQGLTGSSTDEDSGIGWFAWLFALALLLFVAWWFFGGGSGKDAATTPATTTEAAAMGSDMAGAATALTAAPAEGAVAIPTGAGVTTELRDGKPVVKVYFDSGKVDVAPAFSGSATGLKDYLAANPGAKLEISGYADPSGNAALNADLAKKRAQAVQASLVQAGIPEASAQLVKPENVADASVAKDAARRVEVVVK